MVQTKVSMGWVGGSAGTERLCTTAAANAAKAWRTTDSMVDCIAFHRSNNTFSVGLFFFLMCFVSDVMGFFFLFLFPFLFDLFSSSFSVGTTDLCPTMESPTTFNSPPSSGGVGLPPFLRARGNSVSPRTETKPVFSRRTFTIIRHIPTPSLSLSFNLPFRTPQH